MVEKKKATYILVGIGAVLAIGGIIAWSTAEAEADNVEDSTDTWFGGKTEISFSYDEDNDLGSTFYFYYEGGAYDNEDDCTVWYDSITIFANGDDITSEAKDDGDYTNDCWYDTSSNGRRRFGSFYAKDGIAYRAASTEGRIWGEEPWDLGGALEDSGDVLENALGALALWAIAGILFCVACCCACGCCGKDSTTVIIQAPNANAPPPQVVQAEKV